MNNFTSLIINALHKASRFIYRDYFELEMLQGSLRGTLPFCKKSILKLKEELLKELENKFSNIVFLDEIQFNPENYDKDDVLLIDPLEGLENLSRSILHFGSAITYLKRIDSSSSLSAECAVINFPAISETIFAESSKGAWLERSSQASKRSSDEPIVRLKVSKNADDSIAILASDINNQDRCFGSNYYHIAMLCAGKIDGLEINKNFTSQIYPIELITKEAGGQIFIKQNKLIVTNSFISEKKFRVSVVS
jgi:myo-inositol-1(or 4)-monophosphatase